MNVSYLIHFSTVEKGYEIKREAEKLFNLPAKEREIKFDETYILFNHVGVEFLSEIEVDVLYIQGFLTKANHLKEEDFFDAINVAKQLQLFINP